MLTVFMAITLGIIVVVSVMAIVMSTSQGADWSETLWKSFRGRSESPENRSQKENEGL